MEIGIIAVGLIALWLIFVNKISKRRNKKVDLKRSDTRVVEIEGGFQPQYRNSRRAEWVKVTHVQMPEPHRASYSNYMFKTIEKAEQGLEAFTTHYNEMMNWEEYLESKAVKSYE